MGKEQSKTRRFQSGTTRFKYVYEENKRKYPPLMKTDDTPYCSAPFKLVMELKVVKCYCDTFWCSYGVPIDGKMLRECPMDS